MDVRNSIDIVHSRPVKQLESSPLAPGASRLPAKRSIIDARKALRPHTQTGTFFPGKQRFLRCSWADTSRHVRVPPRPSLTCPVTQRPAGNGPWIMDVYFWKGLQSPPNPFVSCLSREGAERLSAFRRCCSSLVADLHEAQVP